MTAGQDASLPLRGIRVLDLTRMLSGPFATMLLADLGADVVKVEHRRHGDETRALDPKQHGEGHYFISTNRGKRSLALDLADPAAVEVLGPLVSRSDVVVENWRPGKLAALGYGFDWMRERNDRIVLCSISGSGQEGSDVHKPAFDLLTQARSGIMSVNGEPECGPTKLGIPLADTAAGMWAAIAVLGELANPDRRAVHLDISMLDGLTTLLGYFAQLYFATGEAPQLVGSSHPQIAPYGRFRTSDGWMTLMLPTGAFWRRFCRTVGREDLITDPRFRTTADRRARRDELNSLVAGILRERPTSEWESIFEAGDVPAAPVLAVAEALDRLSRSGRGLIGRARVGDGDVDTLGSPLTVGRGGDLGAVPALGAHTDEILRECGFDDEAIARLRTAGLVGRSQRDDTTRNEATT